MTKKMQTTLELQVESGDEESFDELRILREGLSNKLKKAFMDRDAPKFYRLCTQHGYSPQGKAEIELAEVGSLDNLYRKTTRTVPESDPNTYNRFPRQPAVDYEKFIRLSKSEGVNAYDEFNAASTKRKILIESGYKNAYVGKGRKIPLRDASDHRIGAMFKRIYLQAEKNTKLQE